MKPFTHLRGVALVGALALLRAPVALAGDRARPAVSTTFESTPLHLSTGAAALHHTTSSGDGGSIVRTIVGLAIVIAVIYGLAWIMRQAKTAKNPAKGSGLEQIATLPIGSNRSVALVRAGTEYHLLGVAEHGVTTIRTFTEDEAIEAGLPVTAQDEYGDGVADGQPPLVRVVESLRRMTAR